MQLTTNFQLNEFRSKCGRPFPPDVMPRVRELAQNLQVLRDELKRPIKISSGYRSPQHNEAVKGADKSRHLFGDAADFSVTGMTPREVAAVIERLIAAGRMKQGGLSAYRTFVHYDCRGVRARW